MADYKISGERLTAIADAIRAKKDTTAIFTPEQMAVEIEGIVTGNDLPNAEDVSFGTVEEVKEYGMTVNTDGLSGMSNYNTVGWEFHTVEPIAVYGFRYRGSAYNNYNVKFSLWDESGNLLASTGSVTPVTGAWAEWMLDEQVTLPTGQKYTVAVYGYNVKTVKKANVVFNSKIKNASAKTLPDSFGKPIYDDTTFVPVVDIIFGLAQTETPVTEYKVQTATMNQISDEVKRITGATNKLTTEQIINALQGIEAQTT